MVIWLTHATKITKGCIIIYDTAFSTLHRIELLTILLPA